MKKFTLIELLIVVAIIGILASLLLPSLERARTKALEAVCLSNLKQHATGTQVYIVSNDDYLPVSSKWAGKNNYIPLKWRKDIMNYSDAKIDFWDANLDMYDQRLREGVFQCPMAEDKARQSGGYGWNFEELGYSERINSIHSRRTKISAITDPVETLLTGDGNDSTGDWWNQAYLFPDTIYSGLGNRHKYGKAIQVSWADGHASAVYLNKLIPSGRHNFYFLKVKP